MIIRRLIFGILMLPLYHLSGLWRRDPDIWVMGAWYGRRFSDNSKHFFRFVHENTTVRTIWLTREKKVLEEVRSQGCEAVLTYSLKGLLFSLRASCAVVSSGMADVNRYVLKGALLVQLWHGVPLKKIMHDINRSPVSGMTVFLTRILESVCPCERERYHLLLATNEPMRARMAAAFNMPPESVIAGGYPRMDALLNPVAPDLELYQVLKERFRFEKLILYAPTFRDDGDFDPFSEACGWDPSALEELLERTGTLFLINMHFISELDSEAGAADRSGSRIVRLLPGDLPDSTPFLSCVDILITDYSSIFFDYLVMDRPILLAPFDRDLYISKTRGLYDEYDEIAPGPILMRWTDVVAELASVLDGNDTCRERRRQIRGAYVGRVDGRSSERLVTEIRSRLSKRH